MLNILKLLHKNATNSSEGASLKKLIINDINNGSLNIKPPNLLFKFWENQGVLLLNAALSCEVGKANSHSSLWKCFATELIKFIDKKPSKITWFFWGKPAGNLGVLITNLNHDKLFSDHPSRANTNNFYGLNHFNEVKSINWY